MTSPAPRWRRRKTARPSEIVTAALEVFAERGFAAAKLEDIAARAGISKGALYLYFDTKDELFRAVVQETVAPNIEAARAMAEAFPGRFADLAPLLLGRVAQLAATTGLPAVAKMVIGESRNFPDLARVWHDTVVSQAIGLLTGLVTRAQAKGEVGPGEHAPERGLRVLGGQGGDVDRLGAHRDEHLAPEDRHHHRTHQGDGVKPRIARPDLALGLGAGDEAGEQADRLGHHRVVPDAGEIHALGVLVGEPPESLIQTLTLVAAQPRVPAAPPPGLPSDLLRRRPDIRKAERNVAASAADVGAAVADLYPKITLSGQPGFVSTSLSTLVNWGSRNYSVSAGLLWPILEGGRLRAQLAAANARQTEALLAYRQSVLTGLKEVEDALSRYQADEAQRGSLQASLEQARAAEALAREQYRAGVTAYTPVLSAQQAVISDEDQLAQTGAACALDVVGLYRALGGGWTDADHQETTP